MFEPLEGGCLCGRVRYRVTAAPLDGAYCHCRMCQKSSGAPLQASAEFPIGAFEVTEGMAQDLSLLTLGAAPLLPGLRQPDQL
jgi:hypothetical protein